MKLLLDECVTNYLKLDFAAHEVFTVEEAGLKGLKNGKLLRAASGNFDVLITTLTLSLLSHRLSPLLARFSLAKSLSSNHGKPEVASIDAYLETHT
jgi:hypothetical protein